MSALFARGPPQRALLHLNKTTSCYFQCRREEPASAETVKRRKTYSGAILAALSEALLGGGCGVCPICQRVESTWERVAAVQSY